MSQSQRGISVILPTYNEKGNIINLIREIDLYLGGLSSKPLEFIVVDDDSEDHTGETAQRYFSNDPRVKVIRRTGKKCLATAIETGIREATAEVICWMDCDFSMPPFKLVELIVRVHDGFDAAIGSRFVKGGGDIRGSADSWLAVVLSRAMNYFIAFMLGFSFKDYTSGFVAVKREALNHVTIHGDYGEYFIDFVCQLRAHGCKLIEVPYFCLPRRSGVSKTGLSLREYLLKGWKYILLTLKIKFRR